MIYIKTTIIPAVQCICKLRINYVNCILSYIAGTSYFKLIYSNNGHMQAVKGYPISFPTNLFT
jgi:hypothetical protein